MRRYERGWCWFKEKKHMALVFITITMILQLHGCVGCLETERIGLLQLKSYLNSLIPSPQEESILKSWSEDASNSDCCLWERVSCSDAIGGHIVHLSLNEMPSEYLFGDAPLSLNLSLLHSFPQLQTLDFSWNGFNHLFDPIHGYKSFQRLKNLRTLDLSANSLNNSVLPFLTAARSLRTLNLYRNTLEGVFPWNGLINLRELEVLDLSLNKITEFEAVDGLRITNLKKLDLSENKFVEAARLKGLGNLVELKVLSLAGNYFNHTRSIEVLKDMPKLQELDLSDNKFTNLDSLGLINLVELKVLSLAGNYFNHTRSIEGKLLKDMPKLQELDLSVNEFTNLDSLGLVFPSSLQVLDLSRNKFSSTPKGFSNICALMNLRELDLRENAFTSMPYCLGNLRRLRTLDLSYNQLNGNLSSFVSGLPSTLEYLSLLHNNFNGSFWFSSLVNHTRLTVFKLSSEVGTIQDPTEGSWVPLFQLKRLELHNVNLGSTIHGFLVHQHDLCYVDLSHNKLRGAFPTWLVQNNTRLQMLLLKSNSLTKLQLPKFVHGLQFLDISSNMIQDSVQEDIGNVFPKLRYMKFASNRFHGTIPSSIGEMKSLEVLDVSSNGLSGKLPKTFLSGCYFLMVLKLSNNQFHGRLREGLVNSKNIRFLDVSDNSFSGSLPLWIGKMSILTHLNMSRNQLTGSFPRHLQNLSRLQVIDISHNRFSGSIPRNLDFPWLLELRLQSNEFMGSIPDSLFEAEKLEVLDLGNNNFSGKIIMNTNGKRSNLRVLLLRNNSLRSHIPKKICQLSEIALLDLSHNKFKGAIPSCLGNMSFGRERYNLSMRIYEQGITIFSSCQYASHLPNVEGIELYDQTLVTIVDFSTKNRDEAYQGDILDDMYGLDLSSNQLSGEIPVEIGDLHSIRSLNFSNNHLTGSIPYSISKLKDLESLDLSNNKLNGNIPPQLADLNSLGYFNVSCNNLSGEIPLKGHLLTFGEMSYIGNAHLCGSPTNKSCNPVTEPNASKQANEEEEEDEGDGVIDMVWFCWTCGAVYISTLLALSAFLFIDSRWSREWFYRVDLLVHHLQCFKGRFICN